VIITEHLYDKEFVEKWCYGFDRLMERVTAYTPNKVAEITWISVDKIMEAAQIYATTKPATLHRRVAIDQNINSTQTGRALIDLVALTGNIDVMGGNLWPVALKVTFLMPRSRGEEDRLSLAWRSWRRD